MSLIDESNYQAMLTPGLYAQVEQNFDIAYLAMLLVRGLYDDLPGILWRNTALVETDEDTTVCHVGNVKLLLYPDSRLGIQVLTHNPKKKKGVMITIWANHGADLSANFFSIDEYGRENEFEIGLPGTMTHPLAKVLSQLRDIVISGGRKLPTKLQEFGRRCGGVS